MPTQGLRWFYRDYVLSCRPLRLDDGRFEARVVIITSSPQKPLSQRFLDLDAFDTEDAAVERARSAGIDWIDANFRVP